MDKRIVRGVEFADDTTFHGHTSQLISYFFLDFTINEKNLSYNLLVNQMKKELVKKVVEVEVKEQVFLVL